MWFHVDRRFLAILTIFLCTLLAWNIARALTTEGQEPEITDMQSYIEYLKNEMQEDPEFQVTFRFQKPLLDTVDDWWVVPYVSDDSELTRDIHSVGEDFICFIESTGSTPAVLCTPYSNIVAVNFASLP